MSKFIKFNVIFFQLKKIFFGVKIFLGSKIWGVWGVKFQKPQRVPNMVLKLKLIILWFQKNKKWVILGHVTSFRRQKRPKYTLNWDKCPKIVENLKFQAKLELQIQFTIKNVEKIFGVKFLNFGVKFSKFGGLRVIFQKLRRVPNMVLKLKLMILWL